MGKSRPRHQKKHRGIIINRERSILIKVIELVFTLLFWLYLLCTFTIVCSITFHLDFQWVDMLLLVFQTNPEDIRHIMYIIGILAVVFMLVQSVWILYNYNRFGKLNRRRHPAAVETKELSEYFQLTESQMQYFQNSKIIKVKDKII